MPRLRSSLDVGGGGNFDSTNVSREHDAHSADADKGASVNPRAMILPVQDVTLCVEFSSGKYRRLAARIRRGPKTEMAGTSPAMTPEKWFNMIGTRSAIETLYSLVARPHAVSFSPTGAMTGLDCFGMSYAE